MTTIRYGKTLISLFLNVPKEEIISKEQELKADKFGSDASESSNVFITALSKLYIYDIIIKQQDIELFKKVYKKDFLVQGKDSLSRDG